MRLLKRIKGGKMARYLVLLEDGEIRLFGKTPVGFNYVIKQNMIKSSKVLCENECIDDFLKNNEFIVTRNPGLIDEITDLISAKSKPKKAKRKIKR